tara:strand:+ start:217 stop:798 length:582 start_codon:yes stop_codon:yes gene_type:complete
MELMKHRPIIFNIIFYVVLFLIFALINSKPEHTYFLVNEIIKQTSILYVVCGLFSLLILTNSVQYLNYKEGFIFPIVVVATAYLGCFVMTYRQTRKCVGKKKFLISMFNSLIPAFFALLGYTLSRKVGWMQQGFHDVVSNGEFSNTGLYMSICYWSSILLIPSVTLSYFGTENYACNTDAKIVIEDIEDMKYM